MGFKVVGTRPFGTYHRYWEETDLAFLSYQLFGFVTVINCCEQVQKIYLYESGCLVI